MIKIHNFDNKQINEAGGTIFRKGKTISIARDAFGRFGRSATGREKGNIGSRERQQLQGSASKEASVRLSAKRRQAAKGRVSIGGRERRAFRQTSGGERGSLAGLHRQTRGGPLKKNNMRTRLQNAARLSKGFSQQGIIGAARAKFGLTRNALTYRALKFDATSATYKLRKTRLRQASKAMKILGAVSGSKGSKMSFIKGIGGKKASFGFTRLRIGRKGGGRRGRRK